MNSVKFYCGGGCNVLEVMAGSWRGVAFLEGACSVLEGCGILEGRGILEVLAVVLEGCGTFGGRLQCFRGM